MHESPKTKGDHNTHGAFPLPTKSEPRSRAVVGFSLDSGLRRHPFGFLRGFLLAFGGFLQFRQFQLKVLDVPDLGKLRGTNKKNLRKPKEKENRRAPLLLRPETWKQEYRGRSSLEWHVAPSIWFFRFRCNTIHFSCQRFVG